MTVNYLAQYVTVKPVHAFPLLMDWWIHSWNIDFIRRFNKPQIQTHTWSGRGGEFDRFLDLHNRPSVGSYIPIHVFQKFLLPIACFKLLKMPKRHAGCFSSGNKRREDKSKEIQVTVVLAIYANWETCHAVRIKFQCKFALIISRADYWNKEWNQYSMNEFISPLMKETHERVWQ